MFKLRHGGVLARAFAVALIGQPRQQLKTQRHMAEELRPVLQRAITRASGTRVDVALSPRPIGATSALALSEWQQGALAEDIVRSTHEGEAIDARIDSALCPPLSETGCDGLALLFGIACNSPQDRGWIEFPDGATLPASERAMVCPASNVAARGRFRRARTGGRDEWQHLPRRRSQFVH
jgi:hypothetical protein